MSFSSRVHGAYRITIDLIRLPWVILRLFLKPGDVEPIFKLGTFRNHRSFLLAEEKILNNPSVAELVRSRYLFPGNYDVPTLAALPEGTLGHAYGAFMNSRGLKSDYYVPYPDPNDDTFAYARKRCPQTHDVWHLVVGIDTDLLGEMKVSAFYVAQIRSPFNALFIGVGLFVALFKRPEQLEDFFNAVTEGWTLGLRARPLLAVKWEDLWDRPLAEVRRNLNIPEIPVGISAIR
jgi:ubiquinone biosynthesis protein COQ4